LRIKSYIIARLEAGGINIYTDEVKKIITTLNQFLGVLVQPYGDLNEIRTSELQFMELK
jgi:predicted transcriptional regulator